MNHSCTCPETQSGKAHLVVLTGGPGAGKTAVLELVRKILCKHVAILPEAATIIFGGGFPRGNTLIAKKAAQRSIYHIQSELELIAKEEGQIHVALCDRGTLDGLAYWPGSEAEFFKEVKSNLDKELSKYAAVIHLKTPAQNNGYNHENPVRTESPEQAKNIDETLLKIWEKHPNRTIIESSGNFFEKVSSAILAISNELKKCQK